MVRLSGLFLCVLVCATTVLISCSTTPATTTTTPPKTTATTTASPTQTATTTSPSPTTTSAAKPKYGGTITLRELTDPTCCDSAANRLMSNTLGLWYAHEQLLKFDWSRGQAGTGEFTTLAVSSPEAMMGGELAESVQLPNPNTWVINLRQNVHYQQTGTEAGKLVNGRLMTADDVVWAYKRNIQGPNTALSVLQPRLAQTMNIEKTGPWQVTITAPVQPVTAQWWVIEGGGYGFMYPKEIVDKYGDLNNWKNLVGTGPWIIDDWVPGSSVSLSRNPNYWGKNPAGPGKGDQLPYADKLKRLIIPDSSTFYAAVRTGKMDMSGAVTYDDFTELKKTAPQLESVEYLGDGFANAHAVNFNLADKTKPWTDKRVRQALMMAFDYDSVISGYFKGKAEKDTILVNKNFDGKGYKPLSTMAQSVQELYKYNPEKAKQLLKEAGFPNGFKAELLVPSVPDSIVDQASIIKELWGKVGVDLTIKPTETAALTTIITRTFAWPDMFFGSNAGGQVGDFGFSLYTYFGYYRGDNRPQFASRTDPAGKPDPIIEAAFAKTQENLYVNWPATYKTIEEIRPYLIENAFKVPFPQPLNYQMWWPWLKNTYGAGPTAYYLKYYWVDQDLKASMGK
jgi:peptide/nickel transport system substrate-binding protein